MHAEEWRDTEIDGKRKRETHSGKDRQRETSMTVLDWLIDVVGMCKGACSMAAGIANCSVLRERMQND